MKLVAGFGACIFRTCEMVCALAIGSCSRWNKEIFILKIGKCVENNGKSVDFVSRWGKMCKIG